MSIAPDIRCLKGRLDRYVWENSATEAVLLRKLLKEHFGQFEGVGIIGGLVRDFARGGRFAFKSDLDLVIDGDPAHVAALAERVGARANRFGGFGFTAGPWKIDFWALEYTWAATAGHVIVRELADVVRCTFFDWDAVMYDLVRKRVVCDKAYLERIRSRRLEISLRPNPGELGNLLRAARRIVRWGLQPGPVLTTFIKAHLDAAAFAEIKETERRKYADRVLDEFEDPDHLRQFLLTTHLGSLAQPGQMALPFDPHPQH